MRSLGVLVEVAFATVADLGWFAIGISAFLNEHVLDANTFIVHIELVLGLVSLGLLVIDVLFVDSVLSTKHQDCWDRIENDNNN